ncbi:MAG: 3-(cis-5,6-dihydroxycyclohexa-1,3-dien-1-yl)propanoate dehydrogenase [Actinobacteria bacterium]|nr:3-(cis-5,6-dihydroxycyclohexa-1,3-dien-1-yl)propanoate dehydrogenase [Actinomycetota bacterium]MCA1737282.1 3-(cis-5,6-dihydroxycyclohexa-1,3-dien-1-yl)propanoate dehydrogenase [Actinomycetota bacterium]
MANGLSGKVALVTGGGSGIGRAVVEAFAGEGVKVGVLDISPEKVEELEALGPDVKAVQGDAISLEDNEKAFSETVETFGRLDALVCCVGLWDNQAKLKRIPKEKLHEAFQEIFTTNVESYVLATKVCADALIESEGCIVYTLSNSSFYPDGGGPLYMASKFAVRGLLVEMAYELAPKVRVNGVAPGGTATEIRGLKSLDQEEPMLASPKMREALKSINPLQMEFDAEDHVGAYLYLTNKELSRGVTGVIINSDGGLGSRGLSKVAGLL